MNLQRWRRLGIIGGAITVISFLLAWIVVELVAEPGTTIQLPMGISYVKGDGLQRVRDYFDQPGGGRSPILAGADVDQRTPPGTYFRDCPYCPLLVVVPAGSYQMGASMGDREAEPTELPVRQVSIPKVLGVAVFETRFDEWDAGVRAGSLPRAQDAYNGVAADFGWGRGARPVINVGWADANSYIRWLNENQGGVFYRLPSEAEWEYFARAGATTIYTYGDRYQTDMVSDGQEGTLPVGRFPPNRFGLYDVQGNVWEWTSDCWAESYADNPVNGTARLDGDCARHPIRGGSWGREPNEMRLSNRMGSKSKGYRLGFRVVRDLPE